MAGKRKGELIFGVGLNDCSYISNDIYGGKNSAQCPYYRSWFHVLRRCYDPKSHAIRPTYVGCSMAGEWHTFSVFRAWMANLNWLGMHLDKDILFAGNKVYGPSTCVFIEPNLNVFLTERSRARGPYPLGVTSSSKGKKFRSRCWNPFSGEREFIGDFLTPERAHEAWRERKHQHACTYADMQTDPRVAAALKTRYLQDKDYSNAIA